MIPYNALIVALLRLFRVVWRRFRVALLVSGVTALTLSYQLIPALRWHWRILIAVAIVFGTGYIENKRKNQSGLSLERRRARLFDYFCRGYIADLRAIDDTARIMVLAVERGPTDNSSMLRNVYSKHMKGDPDHHLDLDITQGVCGEAVTGNTFVAGDLEAEHAATYRLTEEQLKKTKDVTLVMSMPIVGAKIGDDGEPTTTDEVIGVINIDSKMRGAYDFYTEDREGGNLLDRQKKHMAEISEVGAYIMG